MIAIKKRQVKLYLGPYAEYAYDIVNISYSMIDRIRGTILERGTDSIVIESGGIGWRIMCTHECIEAIAKKKEAVILCWLHRDSVELYGFASNEERSFFTLLLSVPGIGPKNALKIMNAYDVRSLKSFIAFEQTDMLTSSMSPKMASKIVIELKNKVHEGSLPVSTIRSNEDLKDALKVLGYTPKEISYALREVGKSSSALEKKIKEALLILSKNRISS